MDNRQWKMDNGKWKLNNEKMENSEKGKCAMCNV